MPSISWSEVNLYRRCPKAHDYKYHQNLEPKRPRTPMLLGKILHEMLEAYVNAKRLKNYDRDPWDVLAEYEDKYKKFFAEEKEEYGDIPAICEDLFERYLNRYRDDGLTYEGVEEFVATDLTGDLRFIGYIDARAVDEQGRRWLGDRKFHRTIPDAEARFHELQLTIYLWAWNRFNPDQAADGILWDYARTQPPTQPDVLKSGELSKKANLRCDRATYEKAIEEHDLDPEDYQDYMTTVLDRKETMFFERVFLPRPSPKMINQIVEDFRTTAVIIQHSKGIAPRHMSKFNCQGCLFKKICEAEVRGLDANFVRKAHYKKRKRHSG